jgi:hypothetical protein
MRLSLDKLHDLWVMENPRINLVEFIKTKADNIINHWGFFILETSPVNNEETLVSNLKTIEKFIYDYGKYREGLQQL